MNLKIERQCIESFHIRVCQALTSMNSNPEQQCCDNTRMQVLNSLLVTYIFHATLWTFHAYLQCF
jgi:hypothetical protein